MDKEAIKEGDRVKFFPWGCGEILTGKVYEGVVISKSAPSIGGDYMLLIEANGQRYERLESELILDLKGDKCPDCIDGKVFNIQHPSTLDSCQTCKGTGLQDKGEDNNE